jgi:thioredoxin-dependent peroxiredoxin
MMTELLWILGSLSPLLLLGMTVATHELKKGDVAPDFSMPGSDGKTCRSADYRGKAALVIAWFPKAFTPGCTAEARSFLTGGNALRKFEVAYFTASCDTPEKNQKFADSLGVDYPILSDPDGQVSRAYGIFDEARGVAQRWTFYIDKDGTILDIDKAVKTSNHAEDVACRLKELGVAERK